MVVSSGIIFLSVLGLAFGTTCTLSGRTASLDSCLQDIKAAGLDNTAYWFGTDYGTMCPQGRADPRLECYNPSADTNPNSIFTRIIGGDPALDRFLEMEFSSSSGEYTACGNTYTMDAWSSSIDPLEDLVVTPWQTKQLPLLDWTVSPGDMFTLIIYDVGYLFFNGVYININGADMSSAEIIKAYVGPQISTSLKNPYAFMLFKQSGQLAVTQDMREKIEQNLAGNVTISDLMTEWSLTALVGMNWIVATGDPYAAQRKLDSSISNTCPDFVAKEMKKKQRTFLPTSPSFDVGVHLKFSTTPKIFQECCTTHTYAHRTIDVNPLDDDVLDTYETSESPTVTFRRKGFFAQMNNFADQLYTLITVDPDVPKPDVGTQERPLLHWLVANINNGNMATGNEYVEYKGPNPPDRKEHYYYFLLYKHEKALSKAALTAYAGGNMCNPGYEERCLYNINAAVSANNLTLVGASWHTAITDIYVAYRKINGGLDKGEWCQGMPGYGGDPTCPTGSSTVPKSSFILLILSAAVLTLNSL